jgi:MATE family multidrug resistance protein
MTGRPATQAEDFPVTHRSVFAIAAPMTLAFISTPLVGLADTWTIGQLGDAALIGAIAVGGIIFDILFTTMNFLRSGTTGLVAQAFGAGRKREEAADLLPGADPGRWHRRAGHFAPDPVFYKRACGSSAAASACRRRWSSISPCACFAAPLTLSNYSVLGYFLGRGEAMTGLALQTVLNLTNIALNILFVLVLRLGRGGRGLGQRAWRTGCVAAWAFAGLARLRTAPWPTRAEVLDRAELIRMMGVNRDIMIRSFALLFRVRHLHPAVGAAGRGDAGGQRDPGKILPARRLLPGRHRHRCRAAGRPRRRRQAPRAVCCAR